MELLFNYFFEFEMKLEVDSQNSDLLEWIYLLICQVFQLEFMNSFVFFHDLLRREQDKEKSFNQTYINFLILIYHLGSKIIENRDQTCLIKEIHNSLKNDEKNDFLENTNQTKFGNFLIKKTDFLILIDWFNDSSKVFLENFNEENLENKEKWSHDLYFLNILIKVISLKSNYNLNHFRFLL